MDRARGVAVAEEVEEQRKVVGRVVTWREDDIGHLAEVIFGLCEPYGSLRGRRRSEDRWWWWCCC